MEYKARLTAPAKDNHYYYSKDNIYYASNVGMPNCTAYVWGRLYELTNKRYTLLNGNAENMYLNAAKAGLTVGREPKLGSIICWRQGVVKNSKDGAGHVAVVEQILDNGDLVCSQSHWNGVEFDTVTIHRLGGYKYKDGFELQGFIYCGLSFSTKEEDIVRQTYIDILCREADASGLKSWSKALQDGLSVDDFRASLLNSAEYKGDTSKSLIENYIVKCYKIILGRYPENDDVVKHWKKFSKEDIFKGIWDSQEAQYRRN